MYALVIVLTHGTPVFAFSRVLVFYTSTQSITYSKSSTCPVMVRSIQCMFCDIFKA